MLPDGLAETNWARLSARIAESTGLNFPASRLSDLQHGMAGAATTFGFADVSACVAWLLSAPLSVGQIQTLANHLTIGETYFFREKAALDLLANTLLPEWVRERKGRNRRLRLWSAACCTGEEAYSLAITLRESLPDLADWDVKILATDINQGFLEKASTGSYSDWSCRKVPQATKELYFVRGADGRYTVVPEIRKMVTFAWLNLAQDTYPARATATEAMDVIFCRNVLIYLTPEHVRRAVGRFHRALSDGGALLVSPSEAVASTFPQFVVSNFPEVILFRKAAIQAAAVAPPDPPAVPQRLPCAPSSPAVALPPRIVASHAQALSLCKRGLHSEAIAMLIALAAGPAERLPVLSLLARLLADQGRHADALDWCNRWIGADKLDVGAHYLRAAILLEQAEPGQAGHSLRHAVFLQPDFVLAHFALGTVARRLGKPCEADRHFANARHWLGLLPPTDVLPESDGLTAGCLLDTIAAATGQDIAS